MILGIAFFIYAVATTLQYGGALRVGSVNPDMMLIVSVVGLTYLKEKRFLWVIGAAGALGMVTIGWYAQWWREMFATLAVIGIMWLCASIFNRQYYLTGLGLGIVGTGVGYGLRAFIGGIPLNLTALFIDVTLNSILIITILYAWKRFRN